VRICAALARQAHYSHAGTVEFLMDADTGKFYFIEVNPRIQVEHTVTEQVTGVDIVKAQIRITEGARVGDDDSYVPRQKDISLRGHALQCRVTTEDPENGFTPDYGKIAVYRSAAGFGIRLDAGTAYSGAVITPYYDSLLVKVTAWGHTPDEAIARMDRALREFRMRGLSTNLQFLENVIAHPLFRSGECTTRFIDTTPELFKFQKRRDRATRLLKFLGEVAVNGNPEMKGRTLPAPALSAPIKPDLRPDRAPPPARATAEGAGRGEVRQWMKDQPQVLLTDTTMRDAHQSLFATRMRTHDMLAHRAALRAHAAATVLAGMLGRRHLRRGAALPEGRPLGAPGPLREPCPTCCSRCCCAPPTPSATPTTPTTSCATSCSRRPKRASTSSASSTR
jgi:pyruvate carboxylase